MPFFRGVRTSKYRHVYGNPARKEKCYENVKITRNAHDSNFCAVNPKFIAVVTETAGGGSFLVLPIQKTGRIEVNMPKVTGHRGTVLDIKWDPFDDNVIASCSDDATIKLWYIPDGGLTENMNQYLVNLRGHQRRIGFIEWHPTASNILASAGYDYKAIVWNVEKGEAITYITCHTDTIYSLSFNDDGSLLATTCKDKKIRVLDPRTGELVEQAPGHQGSKSSKVVFIGNMNKLATTGFSRMCERQFAVWNLNDMSKPERMETIDAGSGTLLPYYDRDNRIMFLAGKGDGNIRYYEIVTDGTGFHYLSEYRSSSPQRGLGSLPKRGLDVTRCEIMRFYKLHSVAGMVEPVAMIVPRKSDMFQDDIYPDTVAPIPALTADEWISGINRDPIMMPMKEDHEVYTPPSAADFRPGSMKNGIIENTGNEKMMESFQPTVDAGYYKRAGSKEKKEEHIVKSPPQETIADAGFFRRTKSPEEQTQRAESDFQPKRQEQQLDLNFQAQDRADQGTFFSPRSEGTSSDTSSPPEGRMRFKTRQRPPEEQQEVVKMPPAEGKVFRGNRRFQDRSPGQFDRSPELEVKEFSEVTEIVKTEQVPQYVAQEEYERPSPERGRRGQWRHTQPVTINELTNVENRTQKQPSPERYQQRPQRDFSPDEYTQNVFNANDDQTDKLKSVHERRRSFEPAKTRESRTQDFKRRTQSDDLETRNRSEQQLSSEGRKVQVFEGATRQLVIISPSESVPEEVEAPSPSSPPALKSEPSPSEENETGYGGPGSYVSRTRTTLISKFGGTVSQNQPAEHSSIRKTESDLTNIDQLRKAYLRQQDEIRRLKAEVASRDMRIRNLERELDELRQ
ncbi:coronin-1C-A-like isoform X2 [Ptychodera flava]